MKSKFRSPSLFFLGLFLLTSLQAIAQSVTFNVTDSNCPDGGKITATATGFTGTVGYQLKQGGTVVKPQGGSGLQASNVFDNLPAGTYTILADDGTTSQESAPATVNVNYTTISASVAPATVSCGSATTSLTVAASGGSGSYLYAITPTNETNAPPIGSFQTSPTFSGLTVDSYKFWVKDNTCASATLINTTGAVNNVPAPDASAFGLNDLPALTFLSPNNYLSGYKVVIGRFVRSGVIYMTATEAESYTVEIMDGSTSVAGPVAVAATGNTNVNVPNGLVNHTLTVILKNTCTGNTKTFAVSQLGPDMTALATCPAPQAMYRLLSYSLVALPATITYINQDGTGNGNQTIVRTTANDSYNYVNFPVNSVMDWKVVDASGAEWSGTHNFATNLVTNAVQWASFANNCVLRQGTIEIIMTGVQNATPIKYEILETPTGSESLIGYIGNAAASWKNDYTLMYNGQTYFPKGRYKIRFIDSGCYNGREMIVNAGGNEATVTDVTKTANCSSFNFNINGVFSTDYEQVIINGPTGTVGLVKASTESYTNMPYGTYTVALRIRNAACNIFSETFTYTAESSIDFDPLNSGGFTCTTGGTGNLTIVASTTIPGATLEYSIDNGTSWQASNIFPGLSEGNYTVIIKENGCGNQRTVSASIISNIQATINNQPVTTTLCEGSNTVLNINAIGGTKYTWTYPDGSVHLGKLQNLTNITPGMAGIYSVIVEAGSCTTPPLEVSLKVTTKPTIDTVIAQTACNGVVKTIAFTGTPAKEYSSATTFTNLATTYNWTNDNPATGLAATGSGDINFTPTNTGTSPLTANISVTAQAAGSCPTTPINFIITVNPSTTIVLSSVADTDKQSVCISNAITDITYTLTNETNAMVTGLPAGLTGTYNAGTFTISGTPTENGTFNYTITANGNCAPATATGTITVSPNVTIALSSAAGTDAQDKCINTAITNITYAVSNGTAATVTGLPAGLTGTYNAGTFTINGTPTESGTFNYTITSTGNCAPATATGTITVNPNATIALSSAAGTDAQDKCINTAITNITYAVSNGTAATVTGLPKGITGSYSNGVFTISGSTNQTGTFNYTVTGKGNCSSAHATGQITINPLPVITLTSDLGTSISKGDAVILTATGGTTYNWSPSTDIQSGQGTSAIKVRPRQTTTYMVTVTNASGCSDVMQITINVTDDYKLIPNNVITPNGDGKNDTWVIKNIDYYPNNTVKIFDRAGRLVYSKKGYNNEWDGSFNGKYLNEDAYIYVIDMGTGIGLVRGTLSIIREGR